MIKWYVPFSVWLRCNWVFEARESGLRFLSERPFFVFLCRSWRNHEYLIWPSIQPFSVFSFDVMKDSCTMVRYSNYVVFFRTRWQLGIILSECTHAPYRYVQYVAIILYICHGISWHWRETWTSDDLCLSRMFSSSKEFYIVEISA